LSGFDEFGEFFLHFTGSSVDQREDFFEFNSNVGSMAIQDWGISVLDLTGVVHDNNLGSESSTFSGGVVLGVRADHTSSNIFDGNVFNVESDIVTWGGFGQSFVMHFDGFDFSGNVSGGKSDGHTGFQDTSFDSSDWNSSNTTNFVNIL